MRLVAPVLLIGLATLLFVRCSTEDMEFLDPFELSFGDEFADLITPVQIVEKEPRNLF